MCRGASVSASRQKRIGLTSSEGVVRGAARTRPSRASGSTLALTDGAPVQFALAGVSAAMKACLTGGIVPPPEANIRGVIAHAS